MFNYGKIYTLKPAFITRMQEKFRKFKLGLYKRKKVNEEKTPFHRHYFMTFKIHVFDESNPQESAVEYEMVVPARAAYFAKSHLDRIIHEKIQVDVKSIQELSDDEYSEYLTSHQEYKQRKISV